ncbi:hypothetical protein AM587_10000476 [Phytophthora nicotianae]|uniref:Uncharacterized protein n=1 Tax=Phytophthora nicotianae TaxID=4792 RepID=A0A0W8CP72_PHYNI|nr:hypothetical protein AM587_10000476 [Phytophthora nicotianae]
MDQSAAKGRLLQVRNQNHHSDSNHHSGGTVILVTTGSTRCNHCDPIWQVRHAAECGSEIELHSCVVCVAASCMGAVAEADGVPCPTIQDDSHGGVRRCGGASVDGKGAAVRFHISPKLSQEQAAEAVNAIFSSISAYDVRQQAGRTYDNAD